MPQIDFDQVLVPGIIDYNYIFIEAAKKTHKEIGHVYQFVNSDETVMLRISDISTLSIESRPGNIEGDNRIFIVTMQNSSRFEFTYQTGNAVRILWKRKMTLRGADFSYENDFRKNK